MNFADLRFWGYLLAALAVALLLRFPASRLFPTRLVVFDKLALMGVGIFLLFLVSWITLVIYLAVAVGTFLGLEWIQKNHSKHAFKYLAVLVPLQLAPLLYFKYANFWFNGVMGADLEPLRNLIIPVGISFYTFQKVAFVVDTLAFKCPLPGFLDYMNFAGFFPQIVAGPIERRSDLLPQMENFRFRWRPDEINEGAGWMVVGFFFKFCLANNLANYFDGASVTNAYLIWLANLVFGLRIYYDFAGYSLIAVGVARCFGVRLTFNFLSPYSSTSIAEFWRRWHVTLSQWFRDYLYIPLGGGRVWYWAFNLMLVFVVSGVWHGAGWNFLFWGLLHAIFLTVNRVCRNLRLPGSIGWLMTMLACFYAWLCFYETNTPVMIAKMKLLIMPSAYGAAALREAAQLWSAKNGIVLAGILFLTTLTLVLEWLSVRRKNEPYFFLRRPVMLIALVILTVILAPQKNNGFIYFAF